MRHPIVLFDGDCNFCRACVRWLLRHDPEGVLRFAPLGSEVADRLLLQHGVRPEAVSSVILLDRGVAWFRSDAVLRSFRHLRGPWRHARHLGWVPRPLRDLGYNLVSHNRPTISRAVGTIHHRYEPSGAERDRFLAT